MPARRSVLSRVGPFAAVLVIVVLGVAAWLIVIGRPGPPASVVSEAGGFSLDLPGGWVVVEPDENKPLMWASAERVTRAGVPVAWLWVVRWSSEGEGALEAAADAAAADVRELWGDVDVVRTVTRHSGERAIALRYARPYSQPVGDVLPAIPGIAVEEQRVVTVSAGQVYEIGIGGWRRLPREAAVLDRHVRLTAPTGRRVLADSALGMQLTVPAEWNLEPWLLDDDSGIVWAAAGPRRSSTGWARLWAFDTPVGDAVADSLAAAERDGTVTSRTDSVIAGRSAVRIDFEQPTPQLARAFFATWHFEGPDGRAWQLLVGGPAPVSALAELVEATLVVRD